MKKIIALTLAGLFIIACSNTIKKERNYTIIKEIRNENLKKVNIDIRLNEEVNEVGLEEIALGLKEERKNFKMLWIFYYLPDHGIGNGAWATTHFSPELNIEILGATKGDKEAMDKIEVTGDIINTWYDNDAMMPNRIYLIKEHNKLYMKILYPKNSLTEASEIINEVTDRNNGDLTRYDYKNNHGEYYLLERNGNLGIYDSKGKIKEAIKE